ncbi:hypothetical protein [Streptomyces sp. NPDC048825]|uniref:hypothetical protein n=1 Tax=Streptomyces sp. NPDC048825 TaxID=3365592 RepID=UPI003713639C
MGRTSMFRRRADHGRWPTVGWMMRITRKASPSARVRDDTVFAQSLSRGPRGGRFSPSRILNFEAGRYSWPAWLIADYERLCEAPPGSLVNTCDAIARIITRRPPPGRVDATTSKSALEKIGTHDVVREEEWSALSSDTDLLSRLPSSLYEATVATLLQDLGSRSQDVLSPLSMSMGALSSQNPFVLSDLLQSLGPSAPSYAVKSLLLTRHPNASRLLAEVAGSDRASTWVRAEAVDQATLLANNASPIVPDKRAAITADRICVQAVDRTRHLNRLGIYDPDLAHWLSLALFATAEQARREGRLIVSRTPYARALVDVLREEVPHIQEDTRVRRAVRAIGPLAATLSTTDPNRLDTVSFLSEVISDSADDLLTWEAAKSLMDLRPVPESTILGLLRRVPPRPVSHGAQAAALSLLELALLSRVEASRIRTQRVLTVRESEWVAEIERREGNARSSA